MNITIPYPPSVNHYWVPLGSRLVLSSVGKKYRKIVEDEVWVARYAKRSIPRHPIAGLVAVEIEASKPDNRRRDLDNILKAALDSLTHSGVWLDDSQVVDLRIYWALENGLGLMVKITERET